MVFYQERLWPKPWVWAVPVFLIAILAIAYGAAYGVTWAWTIFIPATALAVAGITALSGRIAVSDQSLRVGRAHIPVTVLCDLQIVEPTELTGFLRDGDPRTFLMVRTWSTNKALRMTIDDSDDPHGHWLITTRHPHQLMAAITACQVANAVEP